MRNVFTQLAKTVLIPLGLTAATSAVDREIHKISQNLEFWSRNNNTKISNKEMKSIMKKTC